MLRFLGALLVVLWLTLPVGAAEYHLQGANLYRGSFAHHFDGPRGSGSGELIMERPGQALDADTVGRDASIADRVSSVVQHPPQPTTFKAVVAWVR